MRLYPFYEPCPDTPSFGDAELGLKVGFEGGAAHAVRSVSEAWPLFGAYRLGPATLAEVAERPKAFVRVVVTHKQSGRVFLGGVLSDDDEPDPLSGFDEDEAIEVEGGELTALSSYFNVDLKEACGVRPAPGRYWVVALLGPLVSSVLQLDVAGEREEGE